MIFADKLLELAKKDDRICIVTPDMGYGILEKFQNTFPDRYFNVGIAEQNAMSIASGMALSGLKPYVYSIIPFVVHRCLEQIRVDVSYMNLDVKIIGVGAGFEYGAAGATHHGTEDISLIRALPNMTICSPGDNREMEILAELTYQTNTPTYIRIGRHSYGIINNGDIKLSKATIINKGSNIALIATGNMLPIAKQYLDYLKKDKNINASLISIHTIKPIDKTTIVETINTHEKIITFEEHTIIGGLGSAISEIIAENNKSIEFKRIGINDTYSHIVGNNQFIRKNFKLDLDGVIEQCC